MSNFQEVADNHSHTFKNNALLEHIEGYADGTPLKARGGDVITFDVVAVQDNFPQSWTQIQGSHLVFTPNGIGKTPFLEEHKAIVVIEYSFHLVRDTPATEALMSFRWNLNGVPCLNGEQVIGSNTLNGTQTTARLIINLDDTIGGDDLPNRKIKDYTAPIDIFLEGYEYSAGTATQLFKPLYYEGNFDGTQSKVIKPRISISVYGYGTDDVGSSSSHNHAFAELEDDLTPKLGGNLDGNNKNISNVNTLTGAVGTITTGNITTGNITTINSNAITNTTNIDTATLHTSQNIDTRNINLDVATIADTAHAGNGFQEIIQNNGDLYNDVALGHNQLNNVFGFPQGNSNTYYKGFPLMNNILVMKTRDAVGSIIPIGYARLSLTGTTQTFQDRVVYDPLALRCEKVSTAFTRIKVRPQVNNCMWRFCCHYDFDFPVRDINNRVRIYVEQFRGGVSHAQHKLLDLFTNNIENVGSEERTINGVFGEDVILDDEFALYICCDAGSPNQVQICRYINWCVYITPLI